MAIKKQEFYEGAAVHLLVRSQRVTTLRYEAPLFVVNDRFLVYFKYSTRGRSPWGFSFTPDEQLLLERRAAQEKVVIGLICGSDGVAGLTYDQFCAVAPRTTSSVHVSCYRAHGGHYEVNGPAGTLKRKVPPSQWPRIFGE